MRLFKLQAETGQYAHVRYVVAVDIENALKYGSGFPGAAAVTSITELTTDVLVLIDGMDLENHLARENEKSA